MFIVAVFLLLTLVIGICFSIKKTTYREYVVGNKDFATATLVATVLATIFGGGGLMRGVQQVYDLGLYWIVLGLLSSVGLWMIGRLALRMGPFMAHLSTAETIGSIYGKYPRVIAALVGICTCIVSITVQINVMSQAVSMSLGTMDSLLITIFSTLLLIFYSAFGGGRAVTYTDVFQFITFSIIPLLCWLLFVQIGKPMSQIVHTLQSTPKFQFSNLFQFNTNLVGLILLVLSCLVSFIQPKIMHRVYMAAGSIQARKVFSYATIFNYVIIAFIIFVALLVFCSAPDLPKEKVWDYIVAHIAPWFKGFLAISLLAMTMSTADSALNACALMVRHDIVKSLKNKNITDICQLKLAKWTTLIVGLLAMLLTFRCKDLLELMYCSLVLAVPVVTAPLILAILGFRGTTRTAFIGMLIGLLTIAAWKHWVAPITKMDGSFIAMISNGLAMMVAHYLFKQPKGAGWVEPDNAFKQMQQENARKRAERKEMIAAVLANIKATLARLIPSDTTLRLTGLYMIAAAIFSYGLMNIYWSICQALLGVFLTSSKTFFNKLLPNWFISLVLLITLVVYLPLTLLSHWWNLVDPICAASLSLAHCVMIVSVFPLYLGIRIVSVTTLVAIYPISVGLSASVLCSLLPLFMVSLLIMAMMVGFKITQTSHIGQILYLKDQAEVQKAQKLKAALYDAVMPSSGLGKGYGAILAQVVRKIEETISFLDSHMPLYKQDFQNILKKIYDWVAYFTRKEKAKHHALLQPTKITLDKLISKLEIALSQEVDHPPRVLVEKMNQGSCAPSLYIVWDINQIVYLLVQAVLRVSRTTAGSIVRIQLHPTSLRFKQADPIPGHDALSMLFQAVGLVISQDTTQELPRVKECYYDTIDAIGFQEQQEAPLSMDLQQETIAMMVRAHYGYLEASVGKALPTMLLVLPVDVTEVISKMAAPLPIDPLTVETPVTPKEQADSMMVLMQFYDYVCRSSYKSDPIDALTIAGLLLLLRKYFGFKRHGCGQLFYVRAVGIASLLVEWVCYSPKLIYASLLYQLVHHTALPIAYVKEHYNVGVYAFVLNVVGIDTRKDLDHPSLLYVQNRLQEALKEDHVQLSVLFIKLAERLYDLRHAAGHNLSHIYHMATETLAIDVHLANKYLGPEIGIALEVAAKSVLEGGKDIRHTDV